MKTKTPLQQLKLSVPKQETTINSFLTASGTFHDGDLLLNRKGLRLISEENESLPSESKELDLQFSLEDLETMKVIGKGSGGLVQLVRHKWVGTLFALKGLVYLHNERHVIHRDIKPSNLLVNHKGEVKITDFGVSAMLANSMGQRDTFVGTYNYMAPERISGSTYDYKSDIWSLGMVIMECAIGRFPYIQTEEHQAWPSFYELLEAIVGSPPPSAPPDQFSPEFCSFVSSCIQKDPQDRLPALDLLNHPFIKKFEDKDIDLGILVGSLEPPFQQAGSSSSSSLFLLPGFVNTAMGTGADQEICQEKALEKHNDSIALAKQWVIMEGDSTELCDSDSIDQSSFEGSNDSVASSSSSDMMEDATSSTSSSSSSTSYDGPLYELSELMVQLPIK
ncbi:hypothetical protein RHGRI_013163 [Rhododendron griersonianum]|uniref:mitogen-activated protein kinase kinase n=1 Tax=Rhododendron griersonianum TaxID=479676 RepID=A0AAV6K4N9_9ERIC|nr:hypothetical protein RHGRI_013163 [Rhododendron griersonianum]